MKRFLGLLLTAVVVAGTLAGCGSKPASNGTTTPGATGTPDAGKPN
jgi:predicted small lipoprotein YifL